MPVEDIGIDPFDASEFVAMAEHSAVVEAVIASSSDAAPATRNKVRTAIREHKQRLVEAEAEADLEVAMRHLEQRVGLLIKAKRDTGELTRQGERTDLFEGSRKSPTDLGLDAHDAAEFVAMAEHPEIVEAVIATSSDAAPATRNKVRTAIREHKQRLVEAEAEADLEVELSARGLQRLTDPAEIAAMRRRNEVLAMFHGSILDVLRFRDQYGHDELLTYSTDDLLWPKRLSDAQAAIEFISTITREAAA